MHSDSMYVCRVMGRGVDTLTRSGSSPTETETGAIIMPLNGA